MKLAHCAGDDAELVSNVVDGVADGLWLVNEHHALSVRVIDQLEWPRHRTREFSAAIIHSWHAWACCHDQDQSG